MVPVCLNKARIVQRLEWLGESLVTQRGAPVKRFGGERQELRMDHTWFGDRKLIACLVGEAMA